jgi:hypothetical protein
MVITDEELIDICLTIVSISGGKELKGPVLKVLLDRAQKLTKSNDKNVVLSKINQMSFLKDLEIMCRDNIIDIDNSEGYINFNFTEQGKELLYGR